MSTCVSEGRHMPGLSYLLGLDLALGPLAITVFVGLLIIVCAEETPDLTGNRMNLSSKMSKNMMESLKHMGKLVEKAGEDKSYHETDCRYKCPQGMIQMAKPKHKVYPNGCGSPENKMDFPIVPEIDLCCDTHDICYGTYDEEKANCDKALHKCVAVACKQAMKSLGYKGSQIQGCTMMSKLLLGSIMSSSCKDYREYQEKSTLCEENNQKNLNERIEIQEDDDVVVQVEDDDNEETVTLQKDEL